MGAEDLGQVALQGLSMGGGFGGAFFALRWVAMFIADRHDKREERLDASTERLVKQLESRLDDVTKRLEVTEKLLDECKQQHRESEAKVARLEAQFQGYGDARQKIAVEKAAERINKS